MTPELDIRVRLDATGATVSVNGESESYTYAFGIVASRYGMLALLGGDPDIDGSEEGYFERLRALLVADQMKHGSLGGEEMTMQKTTDATRYRSVLTASGLNGKTVTDVVVAQHGSVTAIEVVFSGGSSFIKEKQGLVEVGGTLEWGSGTPAF